MSGPALFGAPEDPRAVRALRLAEADVSRAVDALRHAAEACRDAVREAAPLAAGAAGPMASRLAAERVALLETAGDVDDVGALLRRLAGALPAGGPGR